jgi:hypothetical protein
MVDAGPLGSSGTKRLKSVDAQIHIGINDYLSALP